jgi:hypothetical protein
MPMLPLLVDLSFLSKPGARWRMSLEKRVAAMLAVAI